VQVKVADFLPGSGLIVVPHMDDEALACGGTIAQLPDKTAWHVVYATDGMGSPEPVVPWRDKISPDLSSLRQAEARNAMGFLGIPRQNTHFLNLPDGRLYRHRSALRQALLRFVDELRPDHVLMPFRFDRHPDHLAVNHTLTALAREDRVPGQLTEYFVYYRWRLLPGGDVRRYIRPNLLYQIDIGAVSRQKRSALDCFTSQTTRLYPWQTRANLSSQLLDSVSQEPEMFLRYDRTLPGAAILARAVPWIRIVHRLEPFLKKHKDRAVGWWKRALTHN
jgi:LmbE family N-acetylglucosaminyl deacetylase